MQRAPSPRAIICTSREQHMLLASERPVSAMTHKSFAIGGIIITNNQASPVALELIETAAYCDLSQFRG